MIYGLLEIEIMNSIWKLQSEDEDRDISIADVVENLNNNSIERAYTTIKTVMDRLVSKDTLVRYKNGKKFYYRSAVDKEEAAKCALQMVSSQFFDQNHVDMIRFIEREFDYTLA